MDKFFSPKHDHAPFSQLREVLSRSTAAGHGVYLGHDAHGWCFAEPEQSVMILGPPRSGKTSAFIVPNVVVAEGPVVSTSTKPDVLDATIWHRRRTGDCFSFDPTRSVERSPELRPLRWSPLQSCTSWAPSMSMAHTLVEVGTGSAGRAGQLGDQSHWNERAKALLAPLLLAASIGDEDMRTLLTWVDRRKALPAQQILASEPGQETQLARHLLEGIMETDDRELSGIWSTASGSLRGFRTDQALDSMAEPDFDPASFVNSTDTIYIAAPAHQQTMVAPMVVGLIEDIRQATYDSSARTPSSSRPPVLLALDEVANIAPIPQLPEMISEGGGQGLVTLACLQDLSQARSRWPDRADGLPSLFGTTIVLPGIGDTKTLEALSLLAGEEEVLSRTLSAGRMPSGHPFADMVTGGRPQRGESVSTHWRRRLPPDLIAQGSAGHALSFDRRNRPGWVPLAPFYACEPWRRLCRPDHDLEATVGRLGLSNQRANPQVGIGASGLER
jgi:type IV secretory pathway TraG/TraD family ATPase VirD4